MKNHMWKAGIYKVSIVFFALFLAIGCGGKEDRKAAHLERAREYIEKGKLKEARIELKNAIQLDPDDGLTLYELGEINMKLNQFKEAFDYFARAVSINPDNLKAQLKMGQVFLLAKKTDAAKEK